LEEKMTEQQYMEQQGYTKKDICVCPECGEVLGDDDYEEHTEYHNAITGHCKKCGHHDHWGYFFKDVYVKDGSVS
jgi:hypothetical protein